MVGLSHGKKHFVVKSAAIFGVKSAALSGESAHVHEAIADWSKRLPTVCAGYEACRIFNADETGFFYCALLSRSMVQKVTNVGGGGGGGNAKKRVTVGLRASVTGEKLKPLMIGKAANHENI